MSSFIIKAERDIDFYVWWSDNIEEPLGWGTRAEILGMLFEDDHRAPLAQRLQRLARADEYGTSSRIGDCRWDDETIIFRQQGLLPRADLRALCQMYDARGGKAPKRKAVAHLLMPWEDDDLDRLGDATRAWPTTDPEQD